MCYPQLLDAWRSSVAFTAAFGIGAAPKDGAWMTLMLMDPGPNDFWCQGREVAPALLAAGSQGAGLPKHPQIQQGRNLKA